MEVELNMDSSEHGSEFFVDLIKTVVNVSAIIGTPPALYQGEMIMWPDVEIDWSCGYPAVALNLPASNELTDAQSRIRQYCLRADIEMNLNG